MAQEFTTTVAEERKEFIELGVTGLSRRGGFIKDDFLPDLQGHKAIKVYREMVYNDSTVSSVYNVIKLLCRKVDWRAEAASNDPKDQAAADFVSECMDDMSMTFRDVIDEALSMLIYGFAPHEVVYKKRNGKSEDPTQNSRYKDGRIGWRKMPIRSQDTVAEWAFDETGGIQGLYQRTDDSFERIFIPMDKLLLFRTTVEMNNPNGKSIFRHAYRSWYYKKNMEMLEGIGVERDLCGVPVFRLPSSYMAADATPQERAIYEYAKTSVTNIRRDAQEGLVLPSDMKDGNKLFDFTLVNSGGSRQFNTGEIIARHARDIAMTALADFIFMGTNQVGSFALATSKTSMFAQAITTYLDMISGVMNRYAIPRLFSLNNFDIQELPQIVHGQVQGVDLKEIASYVQALSSAGANLFPNDAFRDHLLGLANLPKGSSTAPDLGLIGPPPKEFSLNLGGSQPDPETQALMDELGALTTEMPGIQE